jgi:HEAT repeat protein
MPRRLVYAVALLIAWTGCRSEGPAPRGRGSTAATTSPAPAPSAVAAEAEALRRAAQREDPSLDAHKRTLCSFGPAAVEPLAPLLKDPDLRVTEAAADVLQTVGGEAAVDRLVRYALSHYQHPSGHFRTPGPGWERLQAIGPRALSVLARVYRESADFERRQRVLVAVGVIGDPGGEPILDLALSDADPRLVQIAAGMLGAVRAPKAQARLVELLRAPDVLTRFGAIQGLGALRDPAAVAPLLKVLLAPDEEVPAWWDGALAGEPTLHSEARQAIDTLTGEPLGGDVEKIRGWLKLHPPR